MSKPNVLGGRDVDSKWSWVVCFASFLIQFVILGIQSSFGTFFIEFLREFKQGESSTAWIGSVSFGLTFMNGPLATALCSRWGSRPVTCLGALMSFTGLLLTSFVKSFPLLYLTYGVVFGLGASFSYFASIAGLTSYFKKRLSLAYGITLAGSGAGTPVMIILLEYMIEKFGWRVTFKFMASIIITVFVGGLTYLPINQGKLTDHSGKSNLKPSKDRLPVCSILRTFGRIFDPEPFKDRAFAVWVVALGFCIFGYFIPFVFVIRMAKDIGVSNTNSTLLIAYLAITQTVFKVLFGRLGDFARERRITILQVIMLLQAIVTILCPLASHYGYPVLVIYVVVFGFSDGCWSVMIGMGTELIVGKSMMPRAFGSLYGLISIPLILGPPIAGVIFDHYGSYDAAFILAGSTIIVGVGLMLIVHKLIQKRTSEKLPFEISSIDTKPCVERPDMEYLMPEYQLTNEARLYSRPSSLVISRVLEDIEVNENTHDAIESFLAVPDIHTGSQLTYQIKCLKLTPLSKQQSDSEDQLSIKSSSSFLQRDRELSLNSDSGRSSLCDEDQSVTSERSRTSTTDSGLGSDMFPGRPDTSELGNLGAQIKDDFINFHLSFSDDIFSNLMERTLEAELGIPKYNYNLTGTIPHLVKTQLHVRLHDARETVV